ncbi:MAG: sugar ABC transporter permease [Lachnospiraceae bacterium]|nr:sugar ABC transporter permease [Lachnospiraceae bacterium]
MGKKSILKIQHYFKNDKENMLYFILPSLLGVLVFVLLPLFDVFLKSFENRRSGSLVGFANYSEVISNDAFRLAAGNMIRFELLSVPLLMVLSFLISVAVFNMENHFIKFAFLLPMAIPSNSVAIIWKILFDNSGIVNGILTAAFHMKPVNFFSGDAVFYLLVGTFVWKNLGYNMLIWLAALSVFPKEISEAARVDGAGEIRIMLQMILPNLKMSTFTAGVLSLVNSFKVYREAYLISGTYPDDHIYMLQHIFNNWFTKLSIGRMAAGAVLTAICFFSVLLIMKQITLYERKGRRRKNMKRKGDSEHEADC